MIGQGCVNNSVSTTAALIVTAAEAARLSEINDVGQPSTLRDLVKSAFSYIGCTRGQHPDASSAGEQDNGRNEDCNGWAQQQR